MRLPSLILCMVLFVVLLMPSASAVVGGETCYASVHGSGYSCTRWCGLGMTQGSNVHTDSVHGTNCVDNAGSAGFSWPANELWTQLRSMTVNIAGPVKKAAIRHFMYDDGVRVDINGQTVFSQFSASTNPALVCRNGGGQWELPGLGSSNAYEAGEESNVPLPNAGGLVEGMNTITIYGCKASGTTVADAWATVCYEYGPGASTSGNGCLAPGACQVTTSCVYEGKNCGDISNGCGGTINCGTCGPNQACVNNVCVTSCTPEADATFCSRNGKNCNPFSGTDNCGNPRTANCGSCPAGQACGGGGTANVCGCSSESNSQFCQRLGKDCGSVSANDNCGRSRTVDCNILSGGCAAPQTCGGGGVPNKCGCTATTCAAQGRTCGALADGCGGTLNCGTCPSGNICKNGGCVPARARCNDDPGCSPASECDDDTLIVRAKDSDGTCVEDEIDCPEGCVSVPTPRCQCSPANECKDNSTLIRRTVEPGGGCTVEEDECPFGCAGGACRDSPNCTPGTRCEGTTFINRTQDPDDGCIDEDTECAPGTCTLQGCACGQTRCEGDELVEVDPDTCDEERSDCSGGCVSSPSPHCGECTPEANCSASGLELITVEPNCETTLEECPGRCEQLPGDDRCRTCEERQYCDGDFAVTISEDCSRDTSFCISGCVDGECNGPPDDGGECTLPDVAPRCVGDVLFEREDCTETEFDCRSDNQECANGECIDTGGNCDDCGDGIFNACDRGECYGLGSCYFVQGGEPETGDLCNSCGRLKDCTSYGDDQQSCEENRCAYEKRNMPDPCTFCDNVCIDDMDHDCVPDDTDNCWTVANPAQEDTELRCALKPNPPYVVDPACGDACQPIIPGERPDDGTIILLPNQSLVRNEIPVYMNWPEDSKGPETIDMVVYTIG